MRRKEPSLDPLSQFANDVSDNDQSWWPFLFLRPKQEARMGSFRVLVLSLLYGTFFGMLANILTAAGGQFGVPAFVQPLAATALLFVTYRATFAVAWNQRAEQLRQRDTPLEDETASDQA